MKKSMLVVSVAWLVMFMMVMMLGMTSSALAAITPKPWPGTLRGQVLFTPQCPTGVSNLRCRIRISRDRTLTIYNDDLTVKVVEKRLTSSGRFSIRLLPGNYKVVVTPPGLNDTPRPITIESKKTTELNFTLSSGIDIH
jgi:carboxypeptidase family protein